jgi:hypothetical protein
VDVLPLQQQITQKWSRAMKRILISMALAGAVFGLVVTAGPTREAKADIAGDIYDACSADWQQCYTTAKSILAVAVGLYHWIDDAFTGVSYLEECIGEGCNTEEVRENHASYREEMIGESGGSFEEIEETVFHDSHRAKLVEADEKAFSLVMLRDFQARGWVVRAVDIANAGG